MQNNSDSLVILVHGFGCAPCHLSAWKKILQTKFPNLLVPELPATHGSFADCLTALTLALNRADAGKYSRLYFAGHSMGGLLARAYLARHRPANAKKLAVIGTPHRGSPLADIALKIPLAGRIFPALYTFLTDPPPEVVTPEIPGLEIASIEGISNTLGWGKLFLPPDSDGRVLIASAQAPDTTEHLIFPLNHNELMFSEEVAGAILNFFLYGTLKKA